MRLILLTAHAIIAFAATSVLNRMAVAPGWIGPVEFAVIRLGAGAAMLAVLLLVRRAAQGAAVWPGTAGRLVGVAGLLVYLFGFSLAYRGLDAGTGALILFGAVQITMFVGALLAHESLPSRRWAGAGLAMAGLALLLTPGAGTLTAMALMAAAGIGWGFYSLAGRKAADPLAATAWNFLLAVPLALALLPILGWQIPQGRGVALAVLSGAFTSGLGYALWYALVPKLGAARAGVAQLAVPMLAAMGGAVLIAEVPAPRFWIASAIVLGGVALANLPARAKAR